MSLVNNLHPKDAFDTLVGSIHPKDAYNAFLGRWTAPGTASLVMPMMGAFGLGLLVGAGVALLVTPRTGRELRDDLSKTAGRITDSVREALPTPG